MKCNLNKLFTDVQPHSPSTISARRNTLSFAPHSVHTVLPTSVYIFAHLSATSPQDKATFCFYEFVLYIITSLLHF